MNTSFDPFITIDALGLALVLFIAFVLVFGAGFLIGQYSESRKKYD